jgi:hypothetical protein
MRYLLLLGCPTRTKYYAGERSSVFQSREVVKPQDANVNAGKPGATPPPAAPTAPSERFLGSDPLAPWVVAAVIVASILVGAAVWVVRRQIALILAVLFTLALAVLDIRELSRLLNQSRPSLVAMTVVSIALHALVVAIAIVLIRTSDPRPASA